MHLSDSRSLSKLSKLKQLNLSQNSLSKEIIRYLAVLPVLNSLDLNRNRMDGRLENADLADMKSLKVLNLQHNFLHGVLPVEGFAASGSLEILDLSYNMFKTIIPAYIGRLTSLKALSLSQNTFYGSLPSKGLCKLEKLEEFDVSFNNLEGILPSCINNLTSLRLLDLSMNKFSGNISSSWIASLKSLQYIDLSHNKFEGLFSFSSLANHSQLQVVLFTCYDYKLQITEISGWIPLFQLQFLGLSNCLKKLSTEIPKFLFHQHNLRVADLSHNKLKGRFPSWLLENNTRLEYLSLRDNSFLGPFHLPPHLNLSISWMDVSANQFYGQLQENIGNLLPNIKGLDLSRNAFEGRLPSSIGNMSGMEKLDASFNNFSGVVPKELVADCSKLEVLKLSRNNFHGDLFSTEFNLTRLMLLDFSDNQFSGTLSKKLLKIALRFLDGSNNHLSGKIPSWICNVTIIETLILRYNFFKGHFQCESFGLAFLDLSHNFLSGSLPSCSGIDSLKHIHFQGNMFSGSIPKAFINALINGSNIVTLDIRENNLSGSIPSILGAVFTLRVLLLNGNSFGGLIPAQLCRLIQVSIMDLSNNNFSGSIPRCFHYIAFGESDYNYANSGVLYWEANYMRVGMIEKVFQLHNFELTNKEDEVQFVAKHKTSSYTGLPLQYMSGLDLSANNLTGPIPHELGMLASLHSLNLSWNQLTGSIPNTFSNLTQLESLDLSHNNLSGEIPSALTGLNFLEVLTVAYNNLSGKIPDTKQFATFDERSYVENPLLCGPPLKKSCNNVDAQPPPSATKPDGKWYKVDLVVFFPSFFVAYFMFFLGAVAFLYFNPYCYWQRRCFDLTEDCLYSCYYFVVDTLRRLSNRLYN